MIDIVPPRFNPFSKPPQDLEASDLVLLRDVVEGWYVEYKQQLPSIRSVAKTISSFANQYGGFLFLGVEESDDGTRGAAGFPGMATSDVAAIETSIREAATAHVHPTPYYEVIRIDGPDSSIGLTEGKTVLLIDVPEGGNPPYVHSSGRIYRRVADASVPKAEADRAILDLLWEKGRQRRQNLSEFLSTMPTVSEAEENLSFAQLYLMTDPLGDRLHRSKATLEEFANLLADASEKGGNMPFDNVFSAARGYVARQVKGNDPSRLLVTFRFYRSCSAIITIPFSSAPADPDNLRSLLDGYRGVDWFVSLLRQERISSCWVVDVNLLLVVMAMSIRKYRRLVAQVGYDGPIFAMVRLFNMWRRIPFLDIAAYEDCVSSYGIPIIQEEEPTAAIGTTPESLLTLKPGSDCYPTKEPDPKVPHMLDAVIDAAVVFSVAANAMGIPADALIKSKGDFVGPDLLDRAKTVMARRTQTGNSPLEDTAR